MRKEDQYNRPPNAEKRVLDREQNTYQQIPITNRDIFRLNHVLKAIINSYRGFKYSYEKENIESIMKFKEILIWEQKKILEILK